MCEPDAGTLHPSDVYAIRGSLEDRIIVSVPTSMTQASAKSLHEELERELGKRVVMVTHNIHFLRLKELTGAEVQRVHRRMPSAESRGKIQ